MGTMGYLEQETPEHKNNYTSNKNKLKANPENKTIGQSYHDLRTEGVRCWAEGQEEKGKQKGKWEGGRDGGRAPRAAARASTAIIPYLLPAWRPL